VSGTSKLSWYARRLGRMSPAEAAWRAISAESGNGATAEDAAGEPAS